MTRSLPILALSLLLMHWTACSGQENEQSEPNPMRVYSDEESVRCAFRDDRGRLWFGTNHEGVWCKDGTDFARYSVEDGLSSNHVSAITADDAGNLWFATTRGLTRYDGETFEAVEIPWDGNEDLWGSGLNAKVALCLLCDRRGDLWFGTWGNGAHRFDPSERLNDGRYEFESFLRERGAQYDNGEHRNAIQSIVEGQDGAIWFTSMSHDGVARFDGEMFEHFGIDDGLSDDMVYSAHVARDGSLWFGMLGNDQGGLDHYDGKSFEHYTVAEGLPSNNVVALLESRDGVLWIGSDRGPLSPLFQEGKPHVSRFTDSGRSFKNILFVTEGADGDVWFGGRRGQLFQLHGGDVIDHVQKRSG